MYKKQENYLPCFSCEDSGQPTAYGLAYNPYIANSGNIYGASSTTICDYNYLTDDSNDKLMGGMNHLSVPDHSLLTN
jgi:hypothetical protein